ncbi:hypothetical protein SprV_0200939500 [Sparganum proliferum]
MLATYYTDAKERSQAFGSALTALALGVLVGPTYGGLVYQFVNKRAPFLMLSALALLDGILQLIIFKPGIRPEEQKGAPLLQLMKDPYILVAAGMVDASMMPQMGCLVDLRHVAVYGSVYAIADAAFCLGFAIGPAVSGSLAQSVGFSWTVWGIAIVSLVYGPFLLFLRNPPRREETQPLKKVSSVKPLSSGLEYDPTEGGLKAYGYED